MKALALLPVLLLAQDDSPRGRARRVLDELAKKHENVETMRAQYVQKRSSALVTEPLVSKGTLYFRRVPGCLVFAVEKPRRARIRLDAKTYQVWRPDQNRLEKFLLASSALPKALFQAMSPRAAELDEGFRVESFATKGGVHAIVLEPKRDDVKKLLMSLELGVRAEDLVLERIAYRDADGDRVEIALEKIEHPDLRPSAFELDVPEGAEVIVHDTKRARARASPHFGKDVGKRRNTSGNKEKESA